jgi:DNA-3-methyladenine glycosylase I
MRVKLRCEWAANGSPTDIEYHDNEWGVPVHSDKKLFEFLLLESAQAGLSWSIILKKREGYRKAFDDFDANKVANYDQRRIQELLTNPSIIRNRLKIQSTITNARAFLKLQQEFGSFDSYLWNLAGSKEVIFLDSQAACITATSGVYKVGSIDGKYLCCKPQQNQPSLNYLHKRIVYENIHLHASAIRMDKERNLK